MPNFYVKLPYFRQIVDICRTQLSNFQVQTTFLFIFKFENKKYNFSILHIKIPRNIVFPTFTASIIIMYKSDIKYTFNNPEKKMINNPAPNSLLIHKNNLQKIYRIKAKHRQQEQRQGLLQTNGIVSPTKLMLIICLIILSISGLFRANNTHWPHVKALTNYFSYFVLQQTDLGIYDRGDNLDETYIQLTTFQDMQEHFLNLVNFVQNYTENGFANFTQNKPKNVDMQYYYQNGTVLKQYVDFQTFRQILLNSDLRKLLLQLRVLYFEIEFGYNEIIDSFKLVFDYQVYSNSMLRLDMSTKYTAKVYEGMLRQEFILRNLQRLVAVVLMILYSIQARKLYYSTQTLSKQFRKNSLYWCISLITINFISIISTTFSPTCAVIQLLPIFQNHDSSNQSAYNFNVNLRYAVPIVFRIITPVYMILSGFILYSLLMYPGEYFDDYATGFFSYFYNNFQYGIYEIFIQIRSRGNVAYLLYVILYFYMVLVGSNLIPAFFCTLIFQKMAQKDLVRFVESQLEFVVCPKCKQECYQKDNYGLQININSPQSPYLRSGTKLKHFHDKSQKITKMYIEQQDGQIKSPSLSPLQTIKSKHKKARELSAELKDLAEQSLDLATESWLKTQITKLQDEIQQF